MVSKALTFRHNEMGDLPFPARHDVQVRGCAAHMAYYSFEICASRTQRPFVPTLFALSAAAVASMWRILMRKKNRTGMSTAETRVRKAYAKRRKQKAGAKVKKTRPCKFCDDGVATSHPSTKKDFARWVCVGCRRYWQERTKRERG